MGKLVAGNDDLHRSEPLGIGAAAPPNAEARDQGTFWEIT